MGEVKHQTVGGSFLVLEQEASELFFPEDLTDEQRLIIKTAQEFVQKDVLTKRREIDNKGYQIVEELLKKAGHLGLLAHSVPEKYEGLGLDKVTKGLVGEAVGASGGYGVAHSNHTCIATLPITYFGTEEQKQQYLPKLASGEYLGAYCLTEPSAGSDALNAKTTAVLNEAGTHYLINGTKQWITNAGFSDTFIVYAKIDGKQFTAFIVEKGTPGLSLGPEENKMGIKGSSTRSVIFEDCPVPVKNILGDIGRGHVIALNCLNLGRYNLGFACLGGAKSALKTVLGYVQEREQFKQQLAQFRLTQEKIADMAVRIFASESIQHRTGGLLEEKLGALSPTSDSKTVAQALSEHAIECAICKVFSSETLDAVVDEALQLHGGYGFMSEYAVENMYRDSRINRIFEGTNEINRLLIPGFLFKKVDGFSSQVQAAFEAFGESFDESNLNREGALEYKVKSLKRLSLVALGLAFQHFGSSIDQEQETLIRLANLVISTYASESVTKRAQKSKLETHNQLAQLFVDAELQQGVVTLREVLVNMVADNQLPHWLAKLQKEANPVPYASFEAKRSLAKKLLEKGQYCF